MPVKMRDVARLAGVSTATVSRAINNPELLNQETLQRVMDAIQELDYKLNLAARRLRTNQTRTIAVVIPTIADPVINQVVEAIEDCAITENYTLLICSTRGDSEREQNYIQLLTQQTMVDGVLYISPRAAPEAVLRLAKGDAPLVLCNYSLEDTPSILLNHVSSIYQTTSYLLSLGHRRIALLNLDLPYYYPARMRRQGFEKAFKEAGLSPELSLIVEIHQPTYDNDDWRDAIVKLLDRADPPTAIVAFNDEVALQVYAVCRARGLNIPGDLSVTGCDDTLPAQYVDPPLTTVCVPAYKQGQLAMDYLFKRMAQKRPRIPEQTLLDVELVVRASCAPPVS